MKQKSRSVLCLALAATLLCCGCGSNAAPAPTEPAALTAEQITTNMQQAIAATPCSKLETIVTLSMSLDAGEMGTLDMSTETITEMALSLEPVSAHTSVTTNVTFGNDATQTLAENYTIEEDGQLVSYLKSGGLWMRLPSGQTEAELRRAAAPASLNPASVSLDETVTQWNGRDVICLKTTLTGSEIEAILSSTLSSAGQQGSTAEEQPAMDYSRLTCDSVIYLDPATCLPLAEEMQFAGMSEMMAPLYQEMGITVEVTECSFTGAFLSYDPQPALTLPEGAAEKAAVWDRLLSGEPDNGDGTFTIREGTCLIDLVPPEGFDLTSKDYDHVTFRREDYREITYMMYHITNELVPGSGESFLAQNDSSERRWNANGGKVHREQLTLPSDTLSFTCDLLATTWGSGREDANLYAWAPVGSDATGTYYLYVEVTDGYNDGMGFSKNADITPEEFAGYLTAAAPASLTAE